MFTHKPLHKLNSDYWLLIITQFLLFTQALAFRIFFFFRCHIHTSAPKYQYILWCQSSETTFKCCTIFFICPEQRICPVWPNFLWFLNVMGVRGWFDHIFAFAYYKQHMVIKNHCRLLASVRPDLIHACFAHTEHQNGNLPVIIQILISENCENWFRSISQKVLFIHDLYTVIYQSF